MEEQTPRYDGTWNDLVGKYAYLKTNKYIEKGYRLGFKLIQVPLSLFHMHNESINIWSHLIGFLLVLGLCCHTAYFTPAVVISKDYAPASPYGHSLIESGRHAFSMIALLTEPELMKNSLKIYHYDALSDISLKKTEEITSTDLETIRMYLPEYMNISDDKLITLINSTSLLNFQFQEEKLLDLLSHSYHKTAKTSYIDNVPKWPIYIFLASAFICLSFSSFYHLIYCVSYEIQEKYKQLDYIGISVLIAGSFYPIIIYSFYCFTPISIYYLTAITTLSIATLFLTLSSYGLSPAAQTIRTLAYALIGLFGVIPAVHILVKYGYLSENYQNVGSGLILMGSFYLIGALMYATRIPERFLPGFFDYVGSSHQWFHVLVVLAVLIHYKTTNTLYSWLANVQSEFCHLN